MKKKTSPTWFRRMYIPVLLMSLPVVSSAQAVTPVSFDFGTDPGETTFSDAGFNAASAGRFTISTQADSVRFKSTANNQTGGITRTFAGLGGGLKNDFTITAKFTLSEFYSNTGGGRPGSIILFANSSSAADINNTGLTIQIVTRNTFGHEDLSITSGINHFRPVNSNTKWDNNGLSKGDILELKVDVSFSGADDMLVNATLTRLNGAGGSRTVSVSTSASTFIGGEYFGFGGRFKNAYTTDLDTFSVIPEPGTLVLLGALGQPAVFRRRR